MPERPNWYDPHNVRTRDLWLSGRVTRPVHLDTNATPLAVFGTAATVTYQEVTSALIGPNWNLTGPTYSFTGSTGVTLPAGKQVLMFFDGTLSADRNPSTWPPSGPLG